jgi:SOS response regulatory protein OraA/RecX
MTAQNIDSLNEDKIDDVFDRIYTKVLNLLSGAIKSQSEIDTKLDKYLNKEKISSKSKKHLKDIVLERLRSLGHYDDEMFTKQFLENMSFSSKPRSKREIKNKLYSKGVDIKIIEKYLSGVDPKKETFAAKKYLDKTIKKFKTPLSFQDKNKIINRMLSKGYDFQIIKPLVDSFDSVK